MPDVYNCKILNNTRLTDGVFSTIIEGSDDLTKEAHPGQFLHIKCGEKLLLRRPVSICGINGNAVRFVFEIKGDGTKWLSERKAGQQLDILGPLGNGFTMPNGNIIVVGGGIGVPPLLYAAQSASSNVIAVLGFRDKSRIILEDDFKAICSAKGSDVFITTDDGSAGIHGTVMMPLEELLAGGKYGRVMSCGPYRMLKAVSELCTRYDIPCEVSLEERMGCGVGACLVCACATSQNGVDDMLRVCADGPVLDANIVKW